MGKHRVYAIDGTKVRLRKELEKEGYKKFNRDVYFPSGLLSCMYDVNTHIVHDFAIIKSFSERDRALKHIETLEKNDILIIDRGYFSSLLLRKIVDKKAHGLFRIQGNLRNKEIIRFVNSSRNDMVIKYSPSETVKIDLRKIGHDINFSEIKLRLLKRKIKGKLYVFATTLTKSEYKAKMFDDLYHKRWDIEELYKISKEHFGIEEMHAKTDIIIRREIYAHIVLINIARLLEHSDDEVEDNKKVNFKACLTAIENCSLLLMLKRMILSDFYAQFGLHTYCSKSFLCDLKK
ncbi:Transposase InsG for insertion sequence element IS4 [Rickettsiales endosymbiont of Trichoplax sp. H2]|nr:Transposase InsG for insertion sequence element IS4 [Rickettsiales endosymbiont of Trichoplax sp. H2]